jgi:transcriptional regulator with XRE-family HTH domain
MTSLYEWLASSNSGARALAVSRLKYQVLKVLHRALARTGMTQADLAKRLGVRKSAVNQVFRGDGNLQISTLAEYLFGMGQELVIESVRYGTQRSEAVREMQREWRESRLLREEMVTQSSTEPWDLASVSWRPTGRSSAGTVTATVRR